MADLQPKAPAAADIAEVLDEELPPSAPASVAPPAERAAVKPRSFGIIGKERSVHGLLGGGTAADVFLWRNRNASAVVLGAATVIWVVFHVLDYHLLTLICHLLISAIGTLFLWSKTMNFINKAPPKIPEIQISEELAVYTAQSLRNDINRALATLREIASGHDLGKLFMALGILWVLSFVGKFCDLLTLLYIAVLLLHTVPVFYENFREPVDQVADYAFVEIKKHYDVVSDQIMSKLPIGPTKAKKQE